MFIETHPPRNRGSVFSGSSDPVCCVIYSRSTWLLISLISFGLSRCPPGCNRGKWRFIIRDPRILKMVHNPGGDWHPGRGDNPTYIFWFCLFSKSRSYQQKHADPFVFSWQIYNETGNIWKVKSCDFFGGSWCWVNDVNSWVFTTFSLHTYKYNQLLSDSMWRFVDHN